MGKIEDCLTCNIGDTPADNDEFVGSCRIRFIRVKAGWIDVVG